MSTNTPAPRALHWPALIIGLLTLEIVLCVVGYTLAKGDRTFAVESDYYKKGLDWDHKNGEDIASQKLGWQPSIAITPFPNSNGKQFVTLTLTDAQGRNIDGATVMLRCFAHARPANVQETELLPAGSGKYVAELDVFRPGLWEFRIMVKRYSDIFMTTLQKELPDMQTGVAVK